MSTDLVLPNFFLVQVVLMYNEMVGKYIVRYPREIQLE